MALQREITVDERRRTSLARIGRPTDRRYLVEEFEDGTIVLTPAVLLPAVEVAALTSPVKKSLEKTLGKRPALRSRGSFAKYAE
jgi:hypothetical protein